MRENLQQFIDTLKAQLAKERDKVERLTARLHAENLLVVAFNKELAHEKGITDTAIRAMERTEQERDEAKRQADGLYLAFQSTQTERDEAHRQLAVVVEAVRAYPEWTDEGDEDGASTGWVYCLVCGGRGYLKGRKYGKESRNAARDYPPVHEDTCLRIIALRE